jgi:AraC family ethanolamine operon transcriptional activator
MTQLLTPEGALQVHCFRDADLCASVFQEWGVQFRQLHPQPFQAAISRFQMDGLSIGRIAVNCRVEIRGEKPQDSIAFATLIEPEGRPHFAHATPLHPNCIFGFDNQRETNFVSSAQGVDVLVVEVDRELMRSLADQLGYEDLNDAFFRQNIVSVLPETMSDYYQYLSQIGFLMDHHPQYLQTPEMPRLLRGDLLPLLMDALSHPSKQLKPLRRAEIVSIAQDYMTANLHRPITLVELSQAVCASRRSLIYGFQDIFGMGPMTYLKQQRLNGVRKALLAGNPKYETVANIAHIWGFYSPGHFARDYKILFGETPSETLRQKNQQCNQKCNL